MRQFTLNEIVEAIHNNGGKIVDDHRHPQLVQEDVYAVSEFTRGGNHKYVVMHYRTLPHCLNELYVDENGIPHVSTNSVGGNVHAGGGKTLEEAIARFNAHDELPESERFGKWGTISNTTLIAEGK